MGRYFCQQRRAHLSITQVAKKNFMTSTLFRLAMLCCMFMSNITFPQHVFPQQSTLLIDGGQTLKRNPAAAYNPLSSTFLVLWQGFTPTTIEEYIYARRIARNGTMGPKEHLFFKGPVSQSLPIVAYNPKTKNNLVLWSVLPLLNHPKDGLYSAILNQFGDLISTKQWLGAIGSGDRAIAYQFKTNQFLQLGDAQFILLDSTGRIRTTSPYPAYLSKSPNQFILVGLADTDYYLVGQADPFTTGRSSSTFTFQRIASDGFARSESIRYFLFDKPSTSSDSLLAAMYDDEKNQILILFSRIHSPYQTATLYSARIDTTGNPVSRPTILAVDIVPTVTVGLCHTPVGFLVAFERDARLWVRELGPGGQPVSAEISLTNEPYDFISGLSIASTTARDLFLVYWFGNTVNQPYNIYGQLLRYRGATSSSSRENVSLLDRTHHP